MRQQRIFRYIMSAAVFAVKAFAQDSFFIHAQLLHHALGGGVFGAALGFDAVKAHFADQILDGGADGFRGVPFALKGRADLPFHLTQRLLVPKLSTKSSPTTSPLCASSIAQ